MLQNRISPEGETLTDSLGRTLTLRTLNPADMLDLIEAGGSAAGNQIWMNYAIVIAGIAAIDGVPAPLPNSKAQIRDLARRLGNEGLSAVAAWIRAVNGSAPENESGESDETDGAEAGADLDVAKN